MASSEGANTARRYFVGIGVGSYDDHTLDLPRAEADVGKVAEWFIQRSGVKHTPALEHLARSPQAAQVTESLGRFLRGLESDDVVVMYLACHGELEGSRTYLFGRNTPREGLAGASIEAGTLGAILGQSKPHNLLMIIDACVAGKLASAVQRAAEDASEELNHRDPHRQPIALVVLSSTYGRDPAHDGRFADAFLKVVSEERWTGTTNRWIDISQLIRGLNEELKDIAAAQVAELRAWITGVAELIPNPNVAKRAAGQRMSTEEFQAHFDPAARGVARGEEGSFFSGRVRELKRIVGWLEDSATPSLMVITGAPGSGKSALLSRTAMLSDPVYRPNPANLATHVQGTIPREGAFSGVIWCHNKSEKQIVQEIAVTLGVNASTPEELFQFAAGCKATIAIDALDEMLDGAAPQLASRVLKPLVSQAGIRLLVATRRKPVWQARAGDASLLDHLGANAGFLIDLDMSPETHHDMRRYVEARIYSTVSKEVGNRYLAVSDLAEQVARASGGSFLVASIAARTAAAGKLSVRPDGSYVLPTEVGDALASYIEALPDRGKARALLRALAWSRGAGLPWASLWPHLATKLAIACGSMVTHYTDDDVRTLLDSAGDLVVEGIEAGQPVYRLFHEALAEHLRKDIDEVQAHDTLAQAMFELRAGRSWRQVQPYVTANLPFHLLGAGTMDQLVELLLDPIWDRARREESGDPLAVVGVADAAIERLLADKPTDLRVVPLCVAHSRAMTTAAPLIIDVFARNGQLARAEMMANNLAYAPDRMLAYRYLCDAYTREHDRVAARRCLEEMRRALPSMPQTHQPMAWCWVAEAAHDAGLKETALEAAKAAVDAAFAIAGDGWDRPNGYFWAGRACARAGLADGTERIRKGLDELDDNVIRLRNQALQAASMVGHKTFLERRLKEFFDGGRYSNGMIRDGNLALALADAGMEAEATMVFDLVGDGAPEGYGDSNKRWAWALARSGRIEQAIRALKHVHDPIEQGKAIARIAAVARSSNDEASLKALIALAKPLLKWPEPRSRARLIRVLWLAGERAEALSLAEQEVISGHANRAMADPRDGFGPEGVATNVSAEDPERKMHKRQMASSIVPVADEQSSLSAEYEAGLGNLDKARGHLAGIAVPQYRARALAAIAKHEPDPEQALAGWLRAMASARRAGRGVVDELVPLGIELLSRAGHSEEGLSLGTTIESTKARWEMESFAEQYESLRRTEPPGGHRTGLLDGLLLVPRRLGQTHRWSRDAIRAGWQSGEDGKRLFVLGLMEGNPGLADVEVLVEGIRASRSAFEQFHALLAAENAMLTGSEWDAVRAAVEAELRGDTRHDGVESGIKWSSTRMMVAQRVLNRGLQTGSQDRPGALPLP